MAARVGFEPATLWSKSIDSTNVPPCPTNGTRSEGVWLHFGVAGPNRCLLGLGLMFFLDWAVQLPFIHSFIMAISIAPLQVHYYSEALPTTARILHRSF